MSRYSLFTLAAMVVLLYFSIIVFILSPLPGERRAMYTEGTNAVGSCSNCQECQNLRYRPSGPVVALVSYPGSGNTWLRHLLQQVTGILTGSINSDDDLRRHGFPAESVINGTVLVVKTHKPPFANPKKFKAAAAILLIRNPREALLAEFNRHYGGHLGNAPKSAFTRKTQGPLTGLSILANWELHVKKELALWQKLYELWLTRFKGRIFVVCYEALVHDTRIILLETLAFLNHTVTEEDITCALVNKQGHYQRKRKLEGFDPYTVEMYQAIKRARYCVASMVSQYHTQHDLGDPPSRGSTGCVFTPFPQCVTTNNTKLH